jgi:serine/threonine protein kinase
MSNIVNTDFLCMGCMSTLENQNSPCTKCGFNLNNYEQNIHQLKPYTILNGKYLIGKVLGEGGFGITYLGWDLNLDIKIALKLLQ